eukprot:366522-Chlamydomonas_euryale.AAC.29
MLAWGAPFYSASIERNHRLSLTPRSAHDFINELGYLITREGARGATERAKGGVAGRPSTCGYPHRCPLRQLVDAFPPLLCGRLGVKL